MSSFPQSFDRTPLENPLNSDKHHKCFRSVAAREINKRDVYPSIYPMLVGALEVRVRKRLEINHGNVIREVLA